MEVRLNCRTTDELSFVIALAGEPSEHVSRQSLRRFEESWRAWHHGQCWASWLCDMLYIYLHIHISWLQGISLNCKLCVFLRWSRISCKNTDFSSPYSATTHRKLCRSWWTPTSGLWRIATKWSSRRMRRCECAQWPTNQRHDVTFPAIISHSLLAGTSQSTRANYAGEGQSYRCAQETGGSGISESFIAQQQQQQQ